MSDVPSVAAPPAETGGKLSTGGGGGGGGFNISHVLGLLKRGDLGLAFVVITILVVLILPMPSFLLDLFLALSITLLVLILMTALFIQTPLEFSSFPTVLFIATMLRLALNLASTRLILANGPDPCQRA